MNYTLDTHARDRLRQYIYTLSPSMQEDEMAKLLRQQLTALGAETHCDHIGNLTATIKGKTEFTLALSAHMDTVALQITNILPSGFLQFRSIGLTPNTLLGQPVVVVSGDKLTNGVIGFDATSQFGQPKGLVFEDLWIDIGARNAEEAALHAKTGDLAVFQPRFDTMNDDAKLITGTSIDNKTGIFCIMEALRELTSNGTTTPPVNIEIIATAQEEVGLRGAAVIAAKSHADACIVVDVDYASDMPISHVDQLGNVTLRRGCGVLFKADNNKILRNIIRSLAQDNNVNIQCGMGRFLYGGTDASQFQIIEGGTPTANLTIPCRYMHSPVETCSEHDLETTVAMLIWLAHYFGLHPDTSFTPQ